VREDLYAPLGMTECFNGMTEDEVGRYREHIPAQAERAKPSLEACNPAGGTIGPAWQLARFYEMLAIGHGRIGPVRVIEEQTIASATGVHAGEGTWTWGLGFNLNANAADMTRPRYGSAPSTAAYGHNGASGMIAFADPEHGIVCATIGLGTRVIDAAYRDLGLVDDRHADADADGDMGDATAPPQTQPSEPDPNGDERSGQNDGMLDRVFDRWDANGDGEVTRDEMPERARMLFARLDRNGDGRLTRDELQR